MACISSPMDLDGLNIVGGIALLARSAGRLIPPIV
jgi:hypothetical protein